MVHLYHALCSTYRHGVESNLAAQVANHQTPPSLILLITVCRRRGAASAALARVALASQSVMFGRGITAHVTQFASITSA